MISARYREIGARMENFQQALPAYVQQIGWNVKKTISGMNSFMLELKKDLSDQAVIKARSYPVGEPELICTPWWFVEYRMDGRSYSMIIDACNGSVLAGQRPWLPKLKSN